MTMDLGLDYSVGRPNLDQVWAAGYRFVLRYLSWLPNPKCISAAELAELRAKGWQVALNWEFDERDALGGGAAGRTHATEAVRQAKALGYPAGCTIYFSADFDVTEQQQPIVEGYMREADRPVTAAGYRMGGYGGYWTIRRLFDVGAIDDGWQTYGWSLGTDDVISTFDVAVELRGQSFLFDSRAAVRQILNAVTVAGADCDIDERVGRTYFMGQESAPSDEEDEMKQGMIVEADASRVLAWVDSQLGRVWQDIGSGEGVVWSGWRDAGFQVNPATGTPYVFPSLAAVGREIGEARAAWAKELAEALPPGGGVPGKLNIEMTGTGTPARLLR